MNQCGGIGKRAIRSPRTDPTQISAPTGTATVEKLSDQCTFVPAVLEFRLGFQRLPRCAALTSSDFS